MKNGYEAAVKQDGDPGNEKISGMSSDIPLAECGEPPRERDGAFSLLYNEDGVSLEISPPCAQGGEIDMERLKEHIERKKIRQVDMDKVSEAAVNPGSRICIAPAQEEFIYNEEAQITVSKDEMEAALMLLPPETGGNNLSFQEIMEEIAQTGVVYGIDEAAVRIMMEKKIYGEMRCFAKGVIPENGIDGRLVFHFDTEFSGKPIINEKDGKVDYKTLQLFEQVKRSSCLFPESPRQRERPDIPLPDASLRRRKEKTRDSRRGKMSNTTKPVVACMRRYREGLMS